MNLPSPLNRIWQKLDEFGCLNIPFAIHASHIVGVIDGIKPATFTDFEKIPETIVAPWGYLEQDFAADIKDLGFAVDVVTEKSSNNNEIKNIIIAKSSTEVVKIRQLFKDLLATPNQQRASLDREIGRLLGYPATAIEYYIERQEHLVTTGELWPMLTEYRFFVHSPNHANKEFHQYDQKIYQALKKHLPKTWTLLRQDNLRNHKVSL